MGQHGDTGGQVGGAARCSGAAVGSNAPEDRCLPNAARRAAMMRRPELTSGRVASTAVPHARGIARNTISCISHLLGVPRGRGPRGAILGPVLLLALMGLLVFPLTAGATGTLDQQAATPDGNFEDSFSGKFSAAQTFTAGLSGTLTEVDVYISQLPGGSEPLTVKIEGVNSDGTPNDGQVFVTATVPTASIPQTPSWMAIQLPIIPPFGIGTPSVKGTHYAIVLSSPNPSGAGDVGDAWYFSTSAYNGGGDWSNDGSGWHSLGGIFNQSNFLFKTYVTTPAVATTTGASNTSVAYGTPSVTLSAQVSAAQTVSEGTVTFSVTNSQDQAVGAPTSANVTASGQASATYALPTGTPLGTYTITARYHDALDAVANFSDSQGTGTLQVLDTLPPTTTSSFGSYSPGSWTNQAVTVTLSAIDNPNPGGSGVAATYDAIDTPTCTATTSGLAACSTYSTPFTISANGSHTLTSFSVDQAGNLEAAQTATIRIDTIAPTASPTVSGQQGSNGWYTGPVTVTWHWADNQGGSGLSSTCPATSTYSTPDSATAGLSATCVDIAGNSGTSSVSFKYDATAPLITAQLNPAQPASTGWYNQATGAPTISFSCSDATSGIPAGSCPAASTFGEGANQRYTASVTDNAGNSASAQVTGLYVDLTAPTVTYSGNAGTYTVDQQVAITCAAADSLSGVASTTCRTISGPAYGFGLGMHSSSATATDRAGNTGSGSTSFTVTVTSSSLQTLANRFCTDPSVAASLDQDVTNIATAPNAAAKAGALQAFTSLVHAQTGKSLTSAQANTLLTLATAL